MDVLNIVCVDDKPEVVFKLLHDLSIFSDWIKVKQCFNADEAQAWLEKLDRKGEFVSVVISDQNMPGKHGIDLLVWLSSDRRFRHTKTLMLTNNPTMKVLLDAINKAHVDRFFVKPWDEEALVNEVRILVTEYVFEKGLDYMPLRDKLDSDMILKYLY